MWTRCINPKQRSWHNYGGRGIGVCSRWKSFEAFLADMGERPDGCTLDRIDRDGNYSPENCRWATVKRQCRNKRNTLTVEHDGKCLPLADWADLLGVRYGLLYNRIYRYGWAVDRALAR